MLTLVTTILLCTADPAKPASKPPLLPHYPFLIMYGVRPARYTIEELTAQSAAAIRNCTSAHQSPIVWSCAEGRYIHNPEFVSYKHGKFQEV